MSSGQRERILALAISRGVLRSKDIDALGISRTTLSRLVAEGALLRVGRGLYMHPEARG